MSQEIMDRVKLAGITMSPTEQKSYIATPDTLPVVEKGVDVPSGYKRCGKCGHPKKFYLFNKNAGNKTNTSGSCKECQKASAKKSYGKTKKKRNYAKYYQENKEIKQAHARKYYQQNKDVINAKHKLYVSSKAGKKVMKKAHTKRRQLLAANAGVPYTRDMVIERDSKYNSSEHPMCYLCKKPIEDISGASLHLDHVIPVVQGGLDCFTNIASTHKLCNLTREKDARELTVEQVDGVKALANKYIEANPAKFGDPAK